MRKGMILMAMLLVTGVLFFVPRTYKINLAKERPGILYWTLESGSVIAYTYLQAKGDKKPYPVIFLQGGPGAPVYDRNIHMMSVLANRGYEVYLYDLVGCGYSSRLKDIESYTVERHTKDLKEIIHKTGSDKVIVIGQSWGAILASALLTSYPENVERIIFTSPGYLLPYNPEAAMTPEPDSLNLKHPQFTNNQGRKKVYNLKAKIVEFCARAYNVKLASDNEMDRFETVLNREMSKSTTCSPVNQEIPEYLSGFYCRVKTVQSFRQTKNIRAGLKNCQVPVLILRGQCDGIPWGHTAEYLHYLPHSKFILIPDAGHSIEKEQPELYIQAICNFMEQND